VRPGAIARLARLRSVEARTAGRRAAALAAEAGRARGAVEAIGARVAEGRVRASAQGTPSGARAGELLAAAAWRGGWDRASRRAEGEERRAAAEAGRSRQRAEVAIAEAGRVRVRVEALERVAGRLAGESRRAREALREREVEEAWGAG
jgi:hypothetical protein